MLNTSTSREIIFFIYYLSPYFLFFILCFHSLYKLEFVCTMFKI